VNWPVGVENAAAANPGTLSLRPNQPRSPPALAIGSRWWVNGLNLAPAHRAAVNQEPRRPFARCAGDSPLPGLFAGRISDQMLSLCRAVANQRDFATQYVEKLRQISDSSVTQKLPCSGDDCLRGVQCVDASAAKSQQSEATTVSAIMFLLLEYWAMALALDRNPNKDQQRQSENKNCQGDADFAEPLYSFRLAHCWHHDLSI
jgi:hypothetical protein